MNPKSAKQTLLVSLLVSAMVVTIARVRGGNLPEPRQYIGLGSAYFLAAVMVTMAPALGAGLSVLIAVSLLLRHGDEAMKGLIGAQARARNFASARESIVPDLNLTPSKTGFGAAPSASGKWGGAEQACKRVTQPAKELGLRATGKRGISRVKGTGNVSDHSTDCKACYAEDLFGMTWQMDLAAQKIARSLGRNDYDGTTALNLTVTVDGYRIQVLYRTMTGGNHFTHIHVGARLASYNP